MGYMRAPRPDLFISADIETDGPIPGRFSMLSFGLCIAGRFDGRQFERGDLDRSALFYRELKPVAEDFETEALAVNGLDRDRLLTEGMDPIDAMKEANQWVLDHAEGARAVLVAYPV